MTLRHLSAGLLLLALVCSTGCSCGKCFNRSAAAFPPPAPVSAPPCCPDPTAVGPVPTPPPGVAVQPGY
jgi:hypothetical protein